MAIVYKLMKTGGNLPKNAKLRIVPIQYQTAGLRRMSESIVQATSLTSGDIHATILSLKEEIARELKNGNSVHLPGIGYFTVALKGEIYEDPRSHKPRLRKAEVRTIKFRPDRELLHEMANIEVKNITDLHDLSSSPTAEEIGEAIEELLAHKEVFTVRDFRSALNISQSTAYRILSKLEADGKIVDIGSHHCKIFRKSHPSSLE